MKILFLMDPLESVKFYKDTTFVLMLEAAKRGHQVYYLPKGGITKQGHMLFFQATAVTPQPDPRTPFITQEAVTFSEKDIDAVMIRPDPPFDQDYLMATWLLDLLPPSVFVMNRPAGLRSVNEKIWATRFTDLIPATIISRSLKRLTSFIEEQQEVIAKPTDGFGGQSIFYFKKGDCNTQVILETLTGNGRKEIILQKYIPAARQGDKRILLLNGEPLGAILRVHAPDDHRNNFFSGGQPQATEMTPRDLEIIQALKEPLLKQGLYFVGIDILGDWLIEVNVTSPTCLQEMNRAYDQQLEQAVIDFVEEQYRLINPTPKGD